MEIKFGALEVGAFAQEQIGAGDKRHQLVGPSAVTENAIVRPPISTLSARKWIAFHVRNAHRADAHLADTLVTVGFEHDELELSLTARSRSPRETGKHGAEEQPGAFFKMTRTRDHHRACARALAQIFENQEGQAAKMVTVQMANQDDVDVGRFESPCASSRITTVGPASIRIWQPSASII